MSGSSAVGALRFADPLGPRGRRRVMVATIVATVVLLLVIAGAVARFAANDQFAGKLWEPLTRADAIRVLWIALLATLEAAAIAMVLATAAGLLLAVGRLALPGLLRRLVVLWVEFFRGIPLALLLVFLFLGAPRLGFDIPGFWVLTLGLALYNSAVLCEIIRAGVLSLDRGQTEAALAVGLTDLATLRLVVLPQALRRMVPALVSQLVVILKDTSLGVLIAYPDFLRRAQLIGNTLNNRLQMYMVAGAVYLVINLALSQLARWLEGRQARIRKAARSAEIHVRGVEDLTV
jgi:glutamate transport system permease protein